MESSKRRQAEAWLARADLEPAERETLRAFVERYRTDPTLSGRERRALLDRFESVARRLRSRRTL